jgi:hypothetical protein
VEVWVIVDSVDGVDRVDRGKVIKLLSLLVDENIKPRSGSKTETRLFCF